MKKDNAVVVVLPALLLLTAVGVAAIAVRFWGNSIIAWYGALYTFLAPFIIYVCFLIVMFLKEHTGAYRISAGTSKILKIVLMTLIVFLLVDGLGSYMKRLSIRMDGRYRNYYHWLSKNELSAIRPDLKLQTPGVYPPNSKYNLVNSVVNIDRFGFRREAPDPFPELSPDQTFNIIWLGGSVIFGITSDKGDVAAPDMLQEMLRNVGINGKPVRVYNAGIIGMHVQGIVNNLMKRYSSFKPDIVVFYEAINTQPKESVNVGIPMSLIYNSYVLNKYYGHLRSKLLEKRMLGYDPKLYGDSLDALTASIEGLGAFPIYVTFSMPVSEKDSSFTRSYWDFMSPDTYWMAVLVRENNEQLIERAAKRGVTVVDSLPFLDGKGKYFVDHCHLTQKGMELLASLVRDKILEYRDKTQSHK
jgi:hypothetical protein